MYKVILKESRNYYQLSITPDRATGFERMLTVNRIVEDVVSYHSDEFDSGKNACITFKIPKREVKRDRMNAMLETVKNRLNQRR